MALHSWVDDRSPEIVDYNFEDSIVLTYEVTEHDATFWMDMAIDRTSPLWRPPPPHYGRDFRSGVLRFIGATRTELHETHSRPAISADGSTDRGALYSFWLGDGQYRLEGEWGVLLVTGGRVEVTLSDDDATPSMPGVDA